MDASQNGTVLTLTDLRAILSDNLRGLQNGTATPAGSNATSNAVGKMLASVRLEMDYYKSIGKTPHIEMILGQPALKEAEPNGVAAKAKG